MKAKDLQEQSLLLVDAKPLLGQLSLALQRL
jgi:hypothetical protein